MNYTYDTTIRERNAIARTATAELRDIGMCPHSPITTHKYCLIIYFVNALKDLEI